MNKPKLDFCRLGKSIALFTLLFLISACSPFKKCVKYFQERDIQASEECFEKTKNHRIYGPAALGYLERIKASKTDNLQELLTIIHNLCGIEEEIKNLPIKQRTKLRRKDAGRQDFEIARKNLQRRVYEDMATKGTITALAQLEDQPGCWSSGQIDSLRQIVVNKNINPQQQVFENKLDAKWEGTAVTLANETQVRTEAGRSCLPLVASTNSTLTYQDVTYIIQRYGDAIMPENYAAFWQIKQSLWNRFQLHESYCDMDQFKAEHPTNNASTDCWFDAAQDTLCMSQLRPLLTFHRNNRHTALDVDVCWQIVCLSTFAEDVNELNAEESKQVEDVKLMFDLLARVECCDESIDPDEIIADVAYLAEKYQQHQLVFKLVKATVNCFVSRALMEPSRKAITTFRPLCPDTIVCVPMYGFQMAKQDWLDRVEGFLDNAGNFIRLPSPMEAWNTANNDEYTMVSWGGTKEVFFVRRNHSTGEAQVMTSLATPKGWSVPKAVAELSVENDVELLSMSSGGRLMLLKSKGQLLQSFRPDIGRPWLRPAVKKMSSRFAGDAWLSPDDSLLLVNYYDSSVDPINRPGTNLAAMKLMPDGQYGVAKPLGDKINKKVDDEAQPIMALGGRLLLYTSDSNDGLGGTDVFGASLPRPNEWANIGEPINLGIPLNTPDDEDGITYFSEYTGLAYLHRTDPCSGDKDIYAYQLASGVFPPNAMRLAGLVIDENGDPVGGGFMEFTPDYQLNVHSEQITPEGTYNYTVADSTEVVRLFPEVPGYYSERDTTHFLANITKGQILRDTFRLTSFDYIRRNFRLVNSTFINGTAQFDQPQKAYPELNRLAKIAVRMGAEIQLNGHTDNRGTTAENLKLSIARAESVKAFLVSRCGFDPDKIHLKGFGATQPRCEENTADCQNLNRRIEVEFKMPDLPGGAR